MSHTTYTLTHVQLEELIADAVRKTIEGIENPQPAKEPVIHAHTHTQTCEGTKADGSPCQSNVLVDGRYCRHHVPAATAEPAKPARKARKARKATSDQTSDQTSEPTRKATKTHVFDTLAKGDTDTVTVSDKKAFNRSASRAGWSWARNDNGSVVWSHKDGREVAVSRSGGEWTIRRIA